MCSNANKTPFQSHIQIDYTLSLTPIWRSHVDDTIDAAAAAATQSSLVEITPHIDFAHTRTLAPAIRLPIKKSTSWPKLNFVFVFLIGFFDMSHTQYVFTVYACVCRTVCVFRQTQTNKQTPPNIRSQRTGCPWVTRSSVQTIVSLTCVCVWFGIWAWNSYKWNGRVHSVGLRYPYVSVTWYTQKRYSVFCCTFLTRHTQPE